MPLLAPSGSTITLTAAATALPVNGSTDIFAQVIEAGGTPPQSGTLITFTTNLGTVQPSSAETDIAGRVIVKYLAGGGSGTATISALSGGVSASGTNAIKIAVGAAAVGSVALSANPTALSATGGTTTIIATVADSSGNPLAGVPVTFSTDNGSLGTGSVISDANGRAQTTLTTSRTAKVTATAGVATTSGTTTTAASTNSVTVTVNSSAKVTFGSFLPAAPVAGQPVSFTLTVEASNTGAAIQSVRVDFGDGRTQTLGAVSGATLLSHTYSAPGTYAITAIVTDGNGDSFPAVSAITIGNRPPLGVTITTSPSPIQVGTQVAFTVTTLIPSTNTALVQSGTIDFGDGVRAPLTAQLISTAQHVYSTAGAFIATAVIIDTNGGSSSAQTQVIVGTRLSPTVSFGTLPTPTTGTVTTIPVTITASSTSTPTQSLTVNFGDGSTTYSVSTATTTTVNASHVYQSSGTYTVTATVTDVGAVTASTSTPLVVSAGAIAAVLTASPTAGTRLVTAINFSGGGSTPASAITNYLFEFGDGTSQSGSNSSASRTYSAAGTFTVRLTITDNIGRTATTTATVTIS